MTLGCVTTQPAATIEINPKRIKRAVFLILSSSAGSSFCSHHFFRYAQIKKFNFLAHHCPGNQQDAPAPCRNFQRFRFPAAHLLSLLSLEIMPPSGSGSCKATEYPFYSFQFKSTLALKAKSLITSFKIFAFDFMSDLPALSLTSFSFASFIAMLIKSVDILVHTLQYKLIDRPSL